MEKLKMRSSNGVSENIALIKEHFQHCITEATDAKGNVVEGIDVDKLLQSLSNDFVMADGRTERYQLTWPGKMNALYNASAVITDTLRPDRAKSVDFDNTENLYIEGDNLDVLKLLREDYLGKVKVIYIDPPYNTGKDFVYNDRYAQELKDYMKKSGQRDAQGNPLQTNPDSNGRFHTDWLNMLYPRLKVAKDLLSREGVVFISIDYHEMYNLKMICNEIFGEANYVGEIVWQTATDNNPTQIALEHEYILCYAKDMVSQPKWAIESKKAKAINEHYHELKSKLGDDIDSIHKQLRKWINEHESELQGATHYSYVDEKGVYYPGNSANTKPGGYTFDILHPVTHKVCNKPANGYRWPAETFWDADKRGDVEWGETENTVPKIKKRIETVTESLKSYYYEDNRYWTRYLSDMFGGKIFDNPKSLNLIYKLLEFTTDKDSLILDFFSGSATTAHATMLLNARDGGRRKYIMVQWPEETGAKSEARKFGYHTICEIGEERIRRSGKEVMAKYPEAKIDTGFRVLRVDSTNMNDVYYSPNETNGSLFGIENIKPDRSEEDLLFQMMMELGVELSAKIGIIELNGKKVYDVGEGYLLACFDEKINESTVTAIAERMPMYFVTRDSSIQSDSVADNIEQIFKYYSPDTQCKTL